MEIQTLSPAASSALEAELAVLSSQLLALALQVLLDEGAVLPGCLVEESTMATVPRRSSRQRATASVAARTARAGRGRCGCCAGRNGAWRG
jgi:hypothetical protein